VKLACVIHRFGADIAGGSEGHCRLIAEHLALTHEVTILTTTARDHVSWANHYRAGEDTVGRLRVIRFPVDRPRDLHRFRDISDLVFSDRASPDEEQQWFRENGPVAPALLECLQRQGGSFDLVLFWSYRYYNTFFGVPIVGRRAVLLPTAEEDPLVHVDALSPFFALPGGYLFLTQEEERLVGDRAPAATPRRIIGCGIDPPAVADASLLQRLGIAEPYVLYLGRIDPNKGCDTLLRYFMKYIGDGSSPDRLRASGASASLAEARADLGRAEAEGLRCEPGGPAPRVQLVMAGPANMPVPEHPAIRTLGFVDEPTRDALLAHARVLMMPSPYESLSMVLLEAWNRGLPALVNRRCAVLEGQVLRSDGGLYYQSAAEFAGALDYLLAHPDVARQLGAQGRAYVEREYRWPTVMRKIEALLSEVAANSSHENTKSRNHEIS